MGKSKEDARKILKNDGQCLEVEDVAARLENLDRPGEIWDLEIQTSDGIGWVTYSGASLGSMEVEIYFAQVPHRREVVILGTFLRDGEPSWVRIERMKNRLNHCLQTAK
jgi:hypothetical protein